MHQTEFEILVALYQQAENPLTRYEIAKELRYPESLIRYHLDNLYNKNVVFMKKAPHKTSSKNVYLVKKNRVACLGPIYVAFGKETFNVSYCPFTTCRAHRERKPSQNCEHEKEILEKVK